MPVDGHSSEYGDVRVVENRSVEHAVHTERRGAGHSPENVGGNRSSREKNLCGRDDAERSGDLENPDIRSAPIEGYVRGDGHARRELINAGGENQSTQVAAVQ